VAYGLSADGYTPRTEAIWLALFEGDYEARLLAAGLPSDVDWDRDAIEGIVSKITAERLAEIDELVQAVYDALDPNNATGVQLDTVCALVGVLRDAATFSTAVETFTGTAGIFVPTGTIVEGGGTDGKARWSTIADGTVGSGLTVDITVRAELSGATEAGVGDIDEIITPTETRVRIAQALAMLANKKDTNPPKKHGNIPL